MDSLPPEEPDDEERLSAIDRFCTLTYQAAEMKARHLRGIVTSLSFVCVLLALGLGAVSWRASAVEHQREVLLEQLRAERAARIAATLAVGDVRMNVATDALDTQVRRDIVDERMLEQEQRSAELARLAEAVEREKLVKADCVTPKSILSAAGL